MKIRNTLKLATMASLAVLTLAACSDTTISSPGAPDTPVSPPPPPPPPPAGATIDLVPTSGCPTGTSETTFNAIAADGFSDVSVCALGSASGSTTVTTDLSIPANTSIAIRGPVFIGADNKGGAGTPVTLTVGEGVRFFGASSGGTATATDDYMVITRGSKIEAIGTATNPIRFTSRAKMNDEETGSSITGTATTAQWGGLVINGFAPINACADAAATGGSADCEKSGEGSSGLFGGDQASDNSGTLRYVSVEYAGSRLTTEDELNGIAFQGVGAGTQVDHVQVHFNQDDGMEWFGGTVGVKYFVSTGAGDDNIDWTDGWTGKLQFAVVRSTVPSSDDPRGIEADNLNNANAATPFSDPSISNVTMIGTTGNHQGVLLRRGTKGRLVNMIVADFPTGLDIDNTQTFDNYTAGDLQLQSWLLDNTVNFDNDADPPPSFPASANIRTANNTLTDGFFPGQQELNVPVSSLLWGDTFFTQTDYIGAFSPNETVTSNWATFAQPGTLFPAAEANCPTGTTQNGTLDGKKLCVITGGGITTNLHLINGDQLIYELNGPVFIGVDQGPDPAAPLPGSAGATLTIDAGVTVVGADNNDYLVIARGSKILSNGTADRPIVFTAKSKIEGGATITEDTRGIWGGVILNGRAPINACADALATGGTVGCEKSGEGSSGLFGGASADDDSGQLFYTRVEYAGVRLTTDDELNGIAFQGVGSGTEVEYVQVYNNLDDCFEWFGGTVSAKHMLAIGCGDDQFDWTDGWQGSLQYGIAYGPGPNGDVSDDPNGLEGDNLNNANAATPVSTPRISNLTVISGGGADQIGVKLRRGMQGTVANMIVLGWHEWGLDVDDTLTITNANSGALNLQSMFLSGNAADLAADATEPTMFTSASEQAAQNIVTGQTSTMSGFTFRAGRPGVVPGDNENAVPVFDVTGIGNLEATSYIGAVEDANDKWYLGWSIDQAGNLTSAN